VLKLPHPDGNPNKEAVGQHFIDGFPQGAWKSLRKNGSGFSTVSTPPAAAEGPLLRERRKPERLLEIRG
jgi:hypothetical protein